MARHPKVPRCHVCHRRALRFLERRNRYLCDSCGKVFDQVVVERHNPGVVEQQMTLPAG
jgi:transposase-like protein